MVSPNTNLTTGHWLLGIVFVSLAIVCVYKQIALLKVIYQLSERERRKRALVAGLYFYGLINFILMTVGVFLGAPIYSFSCWLTAMALSCVLLPVVILGALNAYMAYLRQDYWRKRLESHLNRADERK